MASQLSGDVFVAFPILTAISGVRAHLPFTSSDNAFLETPKSFAASVIVIPKGFSRIQPSAAGHLGHGVVIAPQPPLQIEEGVHLKLSLAR